MKKLVKGLFFATTLGVAAFSLASCGNKSSEPLKFAIPSDGTNLSRGIKLLESAGLIEVDPKAGYTPQLADITKYVYNIEIVPQDASTLPTLLEDYAGATINGTYAIPRGLLPSRDGLIIEKQQEGLENPYVNIIVARTADKDNELYKTIVEAYQSATVGEYILKEYEEAFFPQFNYNKSDAVANVKETVNNWVTNSTKTHTVKVGVCGANNKQWDAVQYVLDTEYHDQGIYIETVEYSAYNIPNDSLNAGEIDLNAFQHKAYLANEIKNNGYQIESIGDTLIAPLTLYSKKYNSLNAIKEAAGLNK